MRETLTDIRNKLQHGEYKNEEHIRLAVVCRLLNKLGCDMWDPKEVYTEFQPIPAEDRTRVDIALFSNNFTASVYVEVKAVGKIDPNLSEIERQVRDYNRNNTALFSVITDGKSWRLYYSQTGGEFHNKCFKECHLLEDDLEDIERTFILFFAKENILSGLAEDEARKYLQFTNKQRAIQDCLPQAMRLVQSPPYSSLPQAIMELLKPKGILLSIEEITELLVRTREPPIPVQPNSKSKDDSNGEASGAKIDSGDSGNAARLLNPDDPGDMTFSIVKGTIGGESGKNWKRLVEIGIRLAIERGENINSLNALLPRKIKEGIHIDNGYAPIEDLNLSIQGRMAKEARETLVLLAKKLNCPLELNITWGRKSPRAGEHGLIKWPS